MFSSKGNLKSILWYFESKILTCQYFENIISKFSITQVYNLIKNFLFVCSKVIFAILYFELC